MKIYFTFSYMRYNFNFEQSNPGWFNYPKSFIGPTEILNIISKKNDKNNNIIQQKLHSAVATLLRTESKGNRQKRTRTSLARKPVENNPNQESKLA